MGKPDELKPHGIDRAGNPVKLTGTVNWRTPGSASASTVSRGATNGCVGVTKASTSSNTLLISSTSFGRSLIAASYVSLLILSACAIFALHDWPKKRLVIRSAICIAKDLIEFVE